MQVISGDDAVFDAMVFGQPPPQVSQYIAQQTQHAQQLFSNSGHWLMQHANNYYQSVRNDDAFRIARAIVHQVKSLWGTNTFQSLLQTSQVQNAPNVMVRWIMAEPTLRQLYLQGVAAGYGSRYIDSDPGVAGQYHVDYRLLHNGLMTIDTDEDSDVDWTSVSYYDLVDDNEIELTLSDKVNILDTHETVRNAIAAGRDPSCKYDTDLG